MIYVDGYVPNSNIAPVEAFVGGGNNLGWSGSIVSALANDDGTTISCQFDGTENDGDMKAFQVGLAGTISKGGIYRVWVKAKESGSGESWNAHRPALKLVSTGGKDYGVGLAPNYMLLWGPDTSKSLSSTLTWYSITLHLPTTDGEFTANSIGLWTFTVPGGGRDSIATKNLELGGLKVEEIAVG
jgi:hypothetical protein